ncbi:MAG: hypothetical protein QE487_06785 [Fluviicola sp.]|nr:hypothetical protein [Fluviicola sp.]
MTNLKPLNSTYEITNSEESVIHCEEGTVLYIPANTFVFENGKVVSGNIKLSVKECYSTASIIGQGLTTESLGKPLETAGMVYLEAKADGKKVVIKEGKSIAMGFPKSDKNAEMDLFYSLKVGNAPPTWILDYKMFEFEGGGQMEGEGLAKTEQEYPIEVTEDMYDYFLDCRGGNGAVLEAKFKGSDRIIWDFLGDQENSKTSFAKKFFDNEWYFSVLFNIDQNGKMVDFKPAPPQFDNSGDLRQKITPEAFNLYVNYLKSFPDLEPSSFGGGIEQNWEYSLAVGGAKEIDWLKFKKKFRDRFNETKKDASKKISQLDLNYYVFNVTKLGWINCDRFQNLPEDQKTDFIVKTSGNTNLTIRLIFEDDRTILNGITKGDETVFRDMPLNKKVKLIAIGCKSGKPTLASSRTTISTTAVTLKQFKELTIEELEKELNLIN